MFDHRGPQPSDVHPGGNRSITRGTVRFGADAGAHQLVFEGQLKNDRLPLGAHTLKITAPASPPGGRSRTQTVRFAIVRASTAETTATSKRGNMMCKTAKCTIAAAACAFLVCLLLVSSASAAPSWLGPTDLSSFNAFAGDPTVAADQEGDLVAVWDQQVVNGGRPSRGVGAPGRRWVAAAGRYLGPATRSAAPVVAVDPRGDATAVWVDDDGRVYAVGASGWWRVERAGRSRR